PQALNKKSGPLKLYPYKEQNIVRYSSPQSVLNSANRITTKPEQLSSYKGWVFAAASLIAEDEARSPYQWWIQQGSRREEWDIVPINKIDRTLRAILKKPNLLQDWYTFIYVRSLHKSTTGESYIHLIRSSGATLRRGKVIGFELINPRDVIEPVLNEGRTYIIGWKIREPFGSPRIIPAEDMVVDFFPHPYKRFSGMSPIEAFAFSYDLDLYSRIYGVNLLENGAVPEVVLTTDQELLDDEADFIEQRWKDKYSGDPSAVAVLSKGAKVEKIGLSLQDLVFLDLADLTKEDILHGMYRVPKSKLGADVSNRAVARQQDDDYNEHVLGARNYRTDVIFNDQIIPAINQDVADNYIMEHNLTSKAHIEFNLKMANEALERGAITVNQYLEMIGKPRQKDGDVYIIKSGYTTTKSLDPAKIAEAKLMTQPPQPGESATQAKKNSPSVGQPGAPSGPQTEDPTARFYVQPLPNQESGFPSPQPLVPSADIEEQRQLKNQLRGFFRSYQKISKDGGYKEATMDFQGLEQQFGIRQLPALCKYYDESVVEYYERICSNQVLNSLLALPGRRITYE
ncbi:MAG: phage portal protein, partial [Waterburya sp.]